MPIGVRRAAPGGLVDLRRVAGQSVQGRVLATVGSGFGSVLTPPSAPCADYLVCECIPGAPNEAAETDPAVVPADAPGTGCNKYVYYVCNSPGDPWVALPDAKPECIMAARRSAASPKTPSPLSLAAVAAVLQLVCVRVVAARGTEHAVCTQHQEALHG